MKRTKIIYCTVEVEVNLEMDDKDCADMSDQDIENGFEIWREDFKKHIDKNLSVFEQGHFRMSYVDVKTDWE